MNTKNLKAYAPKARRQFMEAVAKRAAHFGIYEDEIAPVSFQGSTAIIEGNAFTKQQGEQRKRLEKRIEEKPLATYKERYDLFVREMAYTWFNRLAALRYMELHDYFEHGFRILSNPSNQDGLPEILDHAADVADMLGLDKAQTIEWQLAGDKQEVLYRVLLLGQCHHLHKVMPFLFEAIDDATELLLPDNLTKTDSILKGLINDIPEEDWEQIEVIGWLYQFYISEHKDAVIGKVVKSEDIPAATQLFTPKWIVKYLVQNSIGRQWLATYPESSIKAKMEYYIEPAEQTDGVNAQLAAITPSSIDPESIKALDPACGSGHILVEMYELLREIYLERGYRLREIPELILTKNIYGLDIDDRAAQLAGFALLMKAREDDRRIFQRVQDGSVKLNIHAFQSTQGWDSSSLWQSLNLDGTANKGTSGELFPDTDDFKQPTGEYAEYLDLLKYLIITFEKAKALGSLIKFDYQYLSTLERFKARLRNELRGSDPAARDTATQLFPIVEQAILLAQKYDAVNLNPPYMGRKGMFPPLKPLVKLYYPDCIWDLYAAFIEASLAFVKKGGNVSLITMQSWMSLPAFDGLRGTVLDGSKIDSLIHLGARAFDSISGEVVRTCAFSLQKMTAPEFIPTFIDLRAGESEKEKISNWDREEIRYCSLKQVDFSRLPGKPISYWIENSILRTFRHENSISSKALSESLNLTGDNDRFLRFLWEVEAGKIGIGKDWLLYAKGGKLRKWYGNFEYVVAWDKNTINYLRKNKTARLIKKELWYEKGITWSLVTSGKPGFRLLLEDSLFDVGGASIVFKDEDIPAIMSFLNSSVAERLIRIFNETKVQLGNVTSLPLISSPFPFNDEFDWLVEMHKQDWDSRETSHQFKSPNILELRSGTISQAVEFQIDRAKSLVNKVRDIEININQHFIKLYDVCDVISSDTPLEQVTLDCNPYYSFGSDWNKANQEQNTNHIIQLISYFVGCVNGRFSLDKEGVIFAGAGNIGFKELVNDGVYKTFPADDDGIMPLASEEWLFEDDATTRFREFVKTVWGAEHIQENLEFVAESLCLNAIKPKKGESAMETIRRYFSTKFFEEHCKMYKKRPIYWLFSSGKEKAFECLVYLHRYNEATLSRMRTEYVTPLMGKYDHQLARKLEEVVEASGTEQRRIEREIKDLEKKQAELRKFDEELKHYAEMRISLDLDDGVKANYGKFGNLLANVKAIHGKAVK
tara:strand:- start:7200 stop:10838 length:3639 start_codon:yes stop_codon:yes gene_type:complete